MPTRQGWTEKEADAHHMSTEQREKGFSMAKRVAEKVEEKLRANSPDADMASVLSQARYIFAERGIVGRVELKFMVSIEASDPFFGSLTIGADEAWGAAVDVCTADFSSIKADKPSAGFPSTARQKDLWHTVERTIDVLVDRAKSWRGKASGATLTRTTTRILGFLSFEIVVEAEVASLLRAKATAK